MLTEVYIEALLVDEELADQVWKAWVAGETGWVQMQMGVVDAGYWAGVKATLNYVFRTTGGTRFLAKNSRFFRADFCGAVQKILAEADSTENISHDTDAGNQKSVDS